MTRHDCTETVTRDCDVPDHPVCHANSRGSVDDK